MRNDKSETHRAVETAIELSRMKGTWEGLAYRYGKSVRRWPEPR